MAVVLSGDGGWAGLDKSLAAAFAAAGLEKVSLVRRFPYRLVAVAEAS
jgi:type IV secretory pathway VirJ component